MFNLFAKVAISVLFVSLRVQAAPRNEIFPVVKKVFQKYCCRTFASNKESKQAQIFAEAITKKRFMAYTLEGCSDKYLSANLRDSAAELCKLAAKYYNDANMETSSRYMNFRAARTFGNLACTVQFDPSKQNNVDQQLAGDYFMHASLCYFNMRYYKSAFAAAQRANEIFRGISDDEASAFVNIVLEQLQHYPNNDEDLLFE